MQINYFPATNERPLCIDSLTELSRLQITTSLSPSSADNNYTLIFVESGNASVSLSDKSFSVNSGSVLLLPPTSIHSIRSTDGLALTFIYASFACKSEFLLNFPIRPIRCKATDYNHIITALDNAGMALQNYEAGLEKSVLTDKNTYINRFNMYMQIACNSLELFLLTLSSGLAVEPAKESLKLTRHANITASVEDYLKARVRENISLQETAQYFGYSVSNIQKIFKAVTGQSIIVYFNKLKLEEAKRLIIANNMTFSQISSYLSFSNPNYFSRIFKTTVGMTPTEYANLHQKENKENGGQRVAARHSNKRQTIKK